VEKPARKTELNVLWHSTGFSPGLSVLCACDYGGLKLSCRLLFASHIGHNVIRKEEKKA